MPGGLLEGENIKESRKQDQLHQGYRNVAERKNILDAGRTVLHKMVFWSCDACQNRIISVETGRKCHQLVYKATPQTVGQRVVEKQLLLELYQNLDNRKSRELRIHHQNVSLHKLYSVSN